MKRPTTLIGYARVSKLEQDTELQLRALQRAGVRKVIEEKRSAVKHRPQLLALLESLREGDTIVVYKLNRFARSLRDLLTILDRIEQVGAGSTRSPNRSTRPRRPAGRMMMQLLGAFAEFERNIIRERSIAGQAIAKSNGAHVGRLPALDDSPGGAPGRALGHRPLLEDRAGQNPRRQPQHGQANAVATWLKATLIKWSFSMSP